MITELTYDQIKENKQRYIELLKSTNREGIDKMIEFLESSDFFTAPASTKYHGNIEGGLCQHSLCVYECLKDTAFMHAPDIPEDSIIIAALLHDMAKVNFYELYDKNVKVDGQWVQEKCYRVREDAFIYGNHEETCEFIARQFVDLTIAESAAILRHMGGYSNDSIQEGLFKVYNAYPLAMFLHIADLIASQYYC